MSTIAKKIMELTIDPASYIAPGALNGAERRLSYSVGYREARHAAAAVATEGEAELRRQIAELEADNARLVTALEGVVKRDGGTYVHWFQGKTRSCCDVVLQFPHAHDCPIVAAGAALAIVKARALASDANAEANAKGGAQ